MARKPVDPEEAAVAVPEAGQATIRNRVLKGSAGKRFKDAARKRLQRARWRHGNSPTLQTSERMIEVIGWVLKQNVDDIRELFEALRLPDAQFDPRANCLRWRAGNAAGKQPGSLTSPRKLIALTQRESE